VLGTIARAIEEYNLHTESPKAKLMMYSNSEPSKEIKDQIIIEGASEYGGSLNKEQLKERLNTSDILVFVESFDPEQIEKVKYSLSTKVPEYMSVGKPILAVGPDKVGSIEYLKGVSLIITNPTLLNERILAFLNDSQLKNELSKKARMKYLKKHDKFNQQRIIIKALSENGEGNEDS
jgi:glycosyltransferase involved in cell wall biosynthesis